MKRLNSNVGSTKAALQERPEILNAIGVNLSVYVLLKVIDELMLVLGFEIVVASKLVSHDCGTSLNEISNSSMNSRMLAISNDSGFDSSATLKCADDYSLAMSTLHSNAIAETTALTLVHIASLAADVGLINLNGSLGPTKLATVLALQSQANAMQHEPCRFLSNADGAANLVRTNAFAPFRNHPNAKKPLVQSDWRVLENGSSLGRELPFGVDALTLPLALVMQEHNVIPTAGRAGHNAIGPAKQSHVGQSVVRVSVENYRLLQGLWLLVIGIHEENNRRIHLICQVY